MLRVFHYVFPYLVEERGRIMEQECSSSELLSDLDPKLVTDSLHNCPRGHSRGERQGELHGCTMTAGEEREISHVLPLLFTLTHALSHPGSSRAHLGLPEGRGEAGWAQAGKILCENKRDPSMPAGWLLFPRHCVSSSHH